MVIKPNEMETRNQYYLQVQKLEKIIDANLKKGNKRIALPSSIELHEYEKGILREIRRIYEDAGWDVEVCNEEGDGPMMSGYQYLKFEPIGRGE